MRHPSAAVVWLILVLWGHGVHGQAASPAADDIPPSRILTVDAVDLCAGREVEGRSEFAIEHGGFVYWFASERSRDEFAADPQRYEIELGGACARMGPLSGRGDARRWAVHDARIYVFASESCRETFIAHPDRLLERDDREPVPAECEAIAGRDLVQRCAAWAGGPEAWLGLRSFVERRSVPYHDATVTMDHHLTLAVELDAHGTTRAWRCDDWDHYGAWGEAVIGDAAWSVARDGADGPVEWRSLASSQQRSLRRELACHPMLALRSALAGEAIVCRVAVGEVDGAGVEWVAVHRDGVTVRLAIAPESGALVAAAFTTRGGDSGFLGMRELRYTSFAEAHGVRWPTGATAWFDGQREESADMAGITVEVNAELEAAWFAGAPAH